VATENAKSKNGGKKQQMKRLKPLCSPLQKLLLLEGLALQFNQGNAIREHIQPGIQRMTADSIPTSMIGQEIGGIKASDLRV
jgi:hypothetical protein